MAASFASRLSGLRQKKISQNQNQEGSLRLTLPADTSQRSTYEPSTIGNNTRTSFRFLKGRIEKGQSTQKPQVTQNNLMNSSKGLSSTQKLTLTEQTRCDFKLVLNDQLTFQEKKPLTQPPKIPLQKRIMIAKQPPKEQIKKQQIPPKKQQPPAKKQETKKQEPPQKIEKQALKQIIVPHQQKLIRQQQAQQSLPGQSQSDLVMCPQGCGRKFNRKALEKHAKACKLVFMSKRKEFNSQAKRLVSKEQATIVKQNKIEEKKKMGMTKGKGFDKTKTGENWKAASEDFRSAIKAMKQDQKEKGLQEEVQGLEEVKIEDKKVVTVTCDYCEKKFNELFIEKHLQNCTKKKEKEREKDKKKTTKR